MDSATLAAFGLLWLLLVAGRIARASAAFPEQTPEVLNLYVINVAMPALVLRSVPGLQVDRDALLVIAVPWLLVGVAAAMVWLLAQALRWSRATLGALLVLVPLGNTAFVGYPAVQALAGDQALPLAVLYDQLGTFIIVLVYALPIIAVFGGGERPLAWALLRRLLSFPPFIALLIGLTLPLPGWLLRMIEPVALSLVPLACFAVGFRFQLRAPDGLALPLALGLGLKLVAMPALALLIAQLVGLGPLATQVVTLQSGMSTMITAGALVQAARIEPELAAAMVGWSLLLAAFTLPLWNLLL